MPSKGLGPYVCRARLMLNTMPRQTLNDEAEEYSEREIIMTPRSYIVKLGGVVLSVASLAATGAFFSEEVWSQVGKFSAHDPGVRAGAAGAGEALSGLSWIEKRAFDNGREQFEEVQSVRGEQFTPETELGLGPRFNLDSCGGCHSHPAIGGTSPVENPQVEVAKKEGANNEIPSFITQQAAI